YCEHYLVNKKFVNLMTLVSPQTKMYLKNFTELGEKVGSHVVPIPPQAYIPVPMGITKLADLVSKEI
ncbi:MAG: hypothetical protein Q4A59_06760, partial [Erysipelotrichaceae bacterium]|nr:hypothetical protein [Erysipelotrichaceae bacterium]